MYKRTGSIDGCHAIYRTITVIVMFGEKVEPIGNVGLGSRWIKNVLVRANGGLYELKPARLSKMNE